MFAVGRRVVFGNVGVSAPAGGIDVDDLQSLARPQPGVGPQLNARGRGPVDLTKAQHVPAQRAVGILPPPLAGDPDGSQIQLADGLGLRSRDVSSQPHEPLVAAAGEPIQQLTRRLLQRDGQLSHDRGHLAVFEQGRIGVATVNLL